MNEKDFLQQLINREEAAYRMLVFQYKKKVYNSCLGMLQNTADAEDVTQEVFIEIFQSIHHFKGASKLSTWIYRITITKSLAFLRKKKTKKRFAVWKYFTGEEETASLRLIPDFIHPGVVLENKERAAILFAAIDLLPENQKAVFILHKLEDLSYIEIAGVLEITLSAVESLMFRAKKNLQKKLSDYYEENEK